MDAPTSSCVRSSRPWQHPQGVRGNGDAWLFGPGLAGQASRVVLFAQQFRVVGSDDLGLEASSDPHR